MSRVAELLTAVAAKLRAARTDDAPVFKTVRAELDRYDLADLVKDSTVAPTARVCLLRAKPAGRTDAGIDLDVSVAIVVVAGRQGRPDPDRTFASADFAALGLLDAATLAIMADPYCGLGQLQAADLGEQLVVAAEQASDKGTAIALMEVRWRLLDVWPARPAVQRALETGREPWVPGAVAIGDGEPEPPRDGQGDGNGG